MTRPARDSPATEAKAEDQQSSSPPAPTNTRSLRQAPPQRQFYQPPAQTPRASSKMSVTSTTTQAQLQQQQQQPQIQSPAPQASSGAGPAAQPAWTPPNSVPLHYSGSSLGPVPMPVMTPGNNPQAYLSQRQMAPAQHRPPKCGTGHPGPAPMTRIVMGLKSGIPEEVEYALSKLVRISFEAEDSLNADDHPGMVESLVHELSALSTLSQYKDSDDMMETPANRQKLDRILEAALVLRNMSIQGENARHMATLQDCKKALVQGITLPSRGGLTELKHYCLDIVESLSSWLVLGDNLAMYNGLKDGLSSDDRGVLIASLRGITRLVHRDEANRLKEIDLRVIERVQDVLLLEDEELLLASLDFLYQYTTVDENVSRLMATPGALDFLKQLRRLLLHQAQEYYSEYHLRARRKEPPPAQIPHLPPEIVSELLSFSEPERATKWMRCCFEEDPDADITQIALWQAYQARFTEFVPQGRPLLAAADFIKNVSVAFVNASAMVIPLPLPPPGNQKFIIKGIKPRHTPLSPKGVEYFACKWSLNHSGQMGRCPAQLATPNDLFAHILDIHLKPPPEGTPAQPLVCQWAECFRFGPAGDSDRRKVIAHVRTHMPDRKFGGGKRGVASPDECDLGFNKVVIRTQRTAVDERGDAAGVALTAALVLRNIARAGHAGEELRGLEKEIHEVAALNAPLSPYIYDLLMIKYEEGDRRAAEA
ncbi:hypothetical protein DFH27DRAFT_288017 [Peziza echinospora]|nr:hypothetical protein DFH27DRAFT_288017 [Peziza echinospora]